MHLTSASDMFVAASQVDMIHYGMEVCINRCFPPSAAFPYLIRPWLPRELESPRVRSHVTSEGVSTILIAYNEVRLCRPRVQCFATSRAPGSTVHFQMFMQSICSSFSGFWGVWYSRLFPTIVNAHTAFGRSFQMMKCDPHMMVSTMSVTRSHDAQIGRQRYIVANSEA